MASESWVELHYPDGNVTKVKLLLHQGGDFVQRMARNEETIFFALDSLGIYLKGEEDIFVTIQSKANEQSIDF